MQSTSFERNDDVMNLGEMSLDVVWQQYDVLHDLVSIDESMMAYYGSLSCIMFIKGNQSDLVISFCVCVKAMDIHNI